MAELQKQIAATARNRGGRRSFDDGVRAELLELLQEWVAAGRSRYALAKELGINDSLLAKWQREAEQAGGPARARLIPVAVAEQTPPEPVAAGPVVVIPGGVRIEGLSVAQVVELVRRLS